MSDDRLPQMEDEEHCSSNAATAKATIDNFFENRKTASKLTSKIQLGIHWTGVKRDWSKVELPAGHANKIFSDRYRLAYYDNGCGMGRKCRTTWQDFDLDSKAKPAVTHTAISQWASASTLPWNKAGVIVASWTKDFPDGLLMGLLRSRHLREHGLLRSGHAEVARRRRHRDLRRSCPG